MLLVEDDRELAGLLAELLADEGYETDAAYDGQRGCTSVSPGGTT